MICDTFTTEGFASSPAFDGRRTFPGASPGLTFVVTTTANTVRRSAARKTSSGNGDRGLHRRECNEAHTERTRFVARSVPRLQRERDARSLVDRAFRIELARHIRAADECVRDARPIELVREIASRLLAGADHDRVDREHAGRAIDPYVKARVVDAFVDDIGVHGNGAATKKGSPDPAGRLREIGADLRRLALKQEHFARRRTFARMLHGARAGERGVDAPFVAKSVVGMRSITVRVREQFGYVESDSAGTDDRHAIAGRLACLDDVDVARDASVVDARDRRLARHDARCDDHAIENAKLVDEWLRAKPHVDAKRREPPIEIAKRLAELLLARNPPREIELPADRFAALEQRHVMPALGCDARAGEARRTGADDRDPLWRICS